MTLWRISVATAVVGLISIVALLVGSIARFGLGPGVAWVAGSVKKEGNRKAVTVPSLGIAFEGDTLQVR